MFSPFDFSHFYLSSFYLVVFEELGAPSQKTSLLGRVTQILIYSRPSPRLADVGLFVRPKSQQFPPRTKSFPCKLNYLHTGRSNAPSRSNSSLCESRTPYALHTGRSNAPSRSNSSLRESRTPYVLQSVTPLHRMTDRVTCVRPLERSTTAKFLESPTLTSQGPIAPFCANGVGKPIAPLRHWGIYIVEHHPHIRLSSGHGSDTT